MTRVSTLCFSSALVLGALVLPMSAKAQVLNRYTVADVAEKVTPAVVNITTRKNAPRLGMGHPFFHRRGPQFNAPQMGAGSGVVIASNGVIVTNNHVVEGADDIRVTSVNGKEFKATLIGQDKPSDLAFLQVKATNLPFLKLGDSSKLRLGELVLAVGNPFGVGQTVTMGIVSAKGRANMGIVEYEDFIQTDAAINPGNSGGALVNLDGELVGINTAILSRSGGAQGVGFSVPSNMVKPIQEQIQAHGKVRRAWLGVSIQDLTSDLAKSMGLAGKKGVVVSDVLDAGPAERAGIRAGDVITAVGGHATHTAAQLKNRIALQAPGSTVRLDLIRDQKTQSRNVKLDERDGQSGVAPGSSSSDAFEGMSLESLTPDLRRQLRLPSRVKGVWVRDISPNSPAHRAGLQEGDVIMAVNQEPVESPADVARLMRVKSSRILLRVWGQQGFRFVVLHR